MNAIAINVLLGLWGEYQDRERLRREAVERVPDWFLTRHPELSGTELLAAWQAQGLTAFAAEDDDDDDEDRRERSVSTTASDTSSARLTAGIPATTTAKSSFHFDSTFRWETEIMDPRQTIEFWEQEAAERERVAENLQGNLHEAQAMEALGEISPAQVAAARRAWMDATDAVDAAQAAAGLIERRQAEKEANAPRLAELDQQGQNVRASLDHYVGKVRGLMDQIGDAFGDAAESNRQLVQIDRDRAALDPERLSLLDGLPTPADLALPETLWLASRPRTVIQAAYWLANLDTLRERQQVLMQTSQIPNRAAKLTAISEQINAAQRLVSELAAGADPEEGPQLDQPDFITGPSRRPTEPRASVHSIMQPTAGPSS